MRGGRGGPVGREVKVCVCKNKKIGERYYRKEWLLCGNAGFTVVVVGGAFGVAWKVKVGRAAEVSRREWSTVRVKNKKQCKLSVQQHGHLH